MDNLGPTSVETKSVDNLFGGDHPKVSIPVTIVSGSGKVARGTVLGRVTASGKYKPYDADNNDGSEVARAVLAYAVDATSADQVSTAWVHGEFNKAALTGIDDAGTLKLQEFGIFIKEAK